MYNCTHSTTWLAQYVTDTSTVPQTLIQCGNNTHDKPVT